MNLDHTRLMAVVEASLAAVQGNKRWTNAICKAAQELQENPYIHWTGHSLLMLSDSGAIYEANGTCQCKAFTSGQPCRHRAAARLVQRYSETIN